MEPVFVDTSAWYAYFDRSDNDHPLTVEEINKTDFLLITTDFVIDETITLIATKLGTNLAYRIGNNLLNEHYARVIQVSLEDQQNALGILSKYSDKKFSFTDCTSFQIMENLKIKRVLSFDIHFRQYGKFVVLP